MKEGAAAAELLAMRKEIERTAQGIGQIRENLDSERRRIQRVVSEYTRKRILLFLEELHARGMTWCTLCVQVFPEGEAKLLLIGGGEEYACHYENPRYGFRDVRGLNRACPACCERVLGAPDSREGNDTGVKDQSNFYAFRVERRDGGHYACKFGEEVKIEDGNCRFPDLPGNLVDNLAGEWNLPPRIEFDPWQDKFIVYKGIAVVGAI